ncbi:hypothetical protein SEA_REYNAULD_12 [Rhodococcus phage Reynauld]|uniref:Uncharacterized protein n=1 Tax=Rhodococcus phage Reynauld TaxID=3062845 RepID=A0ACD4UJJ0_9CAUD|nr:hypothetical protein SEA_REYNAULD_12 [Rhodococcus phage Reynauld]
MTPDQTLAVVENFIADMATTDVPRIGPGRAAALERRRIADELSKLIGATEGITLTVKLSHPETGESTVKLNISGYNDRRDIVSALHKMGKAEYLNGLWNALHADEDDEDEDENQ